MKRLLIANRGEIAVRIIRACRECGIVPIAVFSEADRDGLPVALADMAVPIGAGPARESYLSIERILDAARIAGADAIHPGYGFLSENADFAAACVEAGLTFVGPPASVVRLLGDKIAAKRLMAEAGVPVVPGYNGDDQSMERLKAEAAQIGLPLLIKAAAGGGGRGMRVVRQAEEDFSLSACGGCAATGGVYTSENSLESSLKEAQREAMAAFGDDRVLLERYVERSRHIEVQIFGDTHGNVVHLYERECSIQRRHQKIIEETPSPVLSPELRRRITDAAVRAARAAGYVNAGTVEFLLEERPDGDHAFYFLEVNTRLQVEHPITEMLTGIDLVQLQLRIADGEPLPFTQEQVVPSGHALEVRIYAEDAAANFLPSVGRLAQWIAPVGPNIRVDSGVERGDDVPPYYDPMLAKLIVRGATRAETLARMERALCDFHVLGIQTNIPYLLAIVRHPAFQAGELSTHFLQTHLPNWRPSNVIPQEVLLALAAYVAAPTPQTMSQPTYIAPSIDPWRTTDNWRNG